VSYLLDTNTCIRYLNGESEQVRRRLASVSSESVFLCSMVKAELLFGAAKSRSPDRARAALQVFFAPFRSLPFDDAAAAAYAMIRAGLEREGTPIGPNDLVIAATALASRAILVTHNTREFGRVSGLEWEDWE
jgi:tRNA(fMet)-specific endonuclease VapC